MTTYVVSGTLELTGPIGTDDVLMFGRGSPTFVAPGTLIIDDVSTFDGTVEALIDNGSIVLRNQEVRSRDSIAKTAVIAKPM